MSISEKIIQILSEKKPDFVSGQELSELLNCSRTAVWKHIRALEKEGYKFEAVTRRGYRLLEQPELLDFSEWEKQLNTTFMGKPVHYCKQTRSTQLLALEMAKQGASEGAMAIAEEQTAGKGRFNRNWHSPAGKGLYFSIVLKPNIPLQFVPQLTLLISVALCRSIRQVTGLQPGIKWPNDVLISGKKFAGILLEMHAEDIQLHHVIAGIGINVNQTEEDFPQDIRSTATSLRQEAGRSFQREQLLQAFLEELEQWYIHYLKEGFAHIRMLWEAHNITLGRHVAVQSGNRVYEGKALDIDETGALVLQTEEGQVKCYSGETTIKK